MDDTITTDIFGFRISDNTLSFSIPAGRTSGSKAFQKESIQGMQVAGDTRTGSVLRGISFSMGDGSCSHCPFDGHSKLYVFTLQIQPDP